MDDFFTPPPFQPDSALRQLQRNLRELRPLSQHGTTYELQGHAVLRLTTEPTTVKVELAKRPMHRPDWETRHLKNHADIRQFVDEMKKRLIRWTDE